MDDYIKSRAYQKVDEDSSLIDEVTDEYSSPDLEDAEAFVDPDVEEKDVTRDDVEEAMTSEFVRQSDSDLGDGLDYVRQRGIEGESVDVEDTEGHTFAEDALSVKERVQAIEKLNEEMREVGSDRRFVQTKSDAPQTAYVYDVKGLDYYYKVDEKFRPSDVVEINKDDSWWNYDENERVLKTVLALAEKYPEQVDEVDSVEEAYTFIERALKTADEVVRDEDAFSLEQEDAVVATISQSQPGSSE